MWKNEKILGKFIPGKVEASPAAIPFRFDISTETNTAIPAKTPLKHKTAGDTFFLPLGAKQNFKFLKK